MATSRCVSHPCRRILVVEDDVDVRDSIGEYLATEGVEPVLASTGEAALAALAQGTVPDIVLLDLGMPGMSGEEFLGRLRENPAWRGIPVAVMSGFRRDQFQYVPPADEYLEKPFALDRLNAALASLCGRRGRAPPAPETAAG